MELIKNKIKITRVLELSFDISHPGLYALSISARCRSEKQLGLTDDEDLKIEIDRRRFPKLDNSQKTLDSPAAFSGGKLHNLKKRVVFLTHFSAGRHFLEIIPDQEPLGGVVEQVMLQGISQPDQPFLRKIALDLNEKAEDGDRRPWITFVLVDLPLKEIKTQVTTQRRFLDSDDVKIIIDGQTRRNLRSIFRKFWFWLGSFFKGATQIDSLKANLLKGLHYIEFWADRMPTLQRIEFDLGEEIVLRERAKVIWDPANLRGAPVIAEDNILSEIRKGEEVIVLEKAIKGERPTNPKKENELLASDRWHKVLYKNTRGYVYSETLEIEGETQESIIQKIVEKAKELKIESSLALAVAKVESQFFPYAVSERGAKGVFQITEFAKEDIKREFTLSDDFNIDQNIEAGLRYFLKLKSYYYKNDPEKELKAIAAYRGGFKSIKPEIPLREQKLTEATRWYLEEVLKARQEFQGQYQKGKIKLEVSALLLLGIVVTGGLVFTLFFQKFSFPQKAIEIVQRDAGDELGKTKKTLRVDLDSDKNLDEVLFTEKMGEVRGLSFAEVDVFFKGRFIHSASGYFRKAFTIDFEQDGKKEVILQTVTAQIGRTRIYYLQDNALRVAKDISTEFDNLEDESGIYFVDEDDNKKIDYIILYNFDRPSDCLAKSAEIYQYHQGKLIQFMDAKVSPDWCDIPPEFWGI